MTIGLRKLWMCNILHSQLTLRIRVFLSGISALSAENSSL